MLRIKTLKSAVALIAVTACLGSAIPTQVVAQTTVTVTGTVKTRDGRPVADARVYVPGTNMATRTDARGNYTLAGVPGGPQSVVVRDRDYAPTRVEAKFSTKPSDRARNHVNVTLLTRDEAATVAAQSAQDSAGLDKVGFFRRQSSVRGAYFIGPDQIAGLKPVRVSDIFRGVPVVTEGFGRTGPVLRGAQGCLIAYVDGLPWRSMFPGDLDAYVSSRDVVAAEAYGPGVTPPAPLTRGIPRQRCTTIALWTRSALG
jgi:hypothetical protein